MVAENAEELGMGHQIFIGICGICGLFGQEPTNDDVDEPFILKSLIEASAMAACNAPRKPRTESRLSCEKLFHVDILMGIKLTGVPISLRLVKSEKLKNGPLNFICSIKQ